MGNRMELFFKDYLIMFGEYVDIIIIDLWFTRWRQPPNVGRCTILWMVYPLGSPY